MNITYDCTKALISLCNFSVVPKSISLSAASSCTTGEVAYWCESGFCSNVIDSFYYENYAEHEVNDFPCEGYATWNTGVELNSIDSILSCTGTITQIQSSNVIEVLIINSTQDLFSSHQVYYQQSGSDYYYDITVTTIEGCTTHYTWLYTTESQGTCGIGEPVVSPLTIDVIADSLARLQRHELRAREDRLRASQGTVDDAAIPQHPGRVAR